MRKMLGRNERTRVESQRGGVGWMRPGGPAHAILQVYKGVLFSLSQERGQ